MTHDLHTQLLFQMKCDQIIASDDDDEDEDDEEIQHLKLEIERRRLEKKREKLRFQPAFSDETPKSASNHSSGHSTKSSSSSKYTGIPQLLYIRSVLSGLTPFILCLSA